MKICHRLAAAAGDLTTREREEMVYFAILDHALWISSRWLDYVVQAREMAMKVVASISKEMEMEWEAEDFVRVYCYCSYYK